MPGLLSNFASMPIQILYRCLRANYSKEMLESLGCSLRNAHLQISGNTPLQCANQSMWSLAYTQEDDGGLHLRGILLKLNSRLLSFVHIVLFTADNADMDHTGLVFFWDTLMILCCSHKQQTQLFADVFARSSAVVCNKRQETGTFAE